MKTTTHTIDGVSLTIREGHRYCATIIDTSASGICDVHVHEIDPAKPRAYASCVVHQLRMRQPWAKTFVAALAVADAQGFKEGA